MNNSWIYIRVDANKYAGVLTAMSPESSDMDKRVILKELSFTPEEEGKTIIIDRKEIAEKYGPDYDLRRFMLSEITDGKADMMLAECYAQRSLEMTKIADDIRNRVMADDFTDAVVNILADAPKMEQ